MSNASRGPVLPSIPSARALRLTQVPVRTPDAEPYYVYCDPAAGCSSPSVFTWVSRNTSSVRVVPLDSSEASLGSGPTLPEPATPDTPNTDIRGITLEFGYKSAALSPVDRALLSHWLQVQPNRIADGYSVVVHTDDSGPFSRKLAQQRGEAVMAELRDFGLKDGLQVSRARDRNRRIVVITRNDPVAPAAAFSSGEPAVGQSPIVSAPATLPSGDTASTPPSTATLLAPPSLPAEPFPSEDSSTEKLP